MESRGAVLAYSMRTSQTLPDYEVMGKPRFLFIRWELGSDLQLVDVGVVYGSIGSSHVMAKVFDMEDVKGEGELEIISIDDLSGKGKITFSLFELRGLELMLSKVNGYLVSRYGSESKVELKWIPEVMDYRMVDNG